MPSYDDCCLEDVRTDDYRGNVNLAEGERDTSEDIKDREEDDLII